MLNRKSIGLALALLVFTPFGVIGSPVDHGTLVVADLATVEGIPLPDARRGGGTVVAPAVEEGVVEGHTTFAVVEVTRYTDAPSTLAVVGRVACPYSVLGMDLPPSRVTDAFTPGCRVGDTVLVAERGAPAPASRADLEPTGWETVVEAPDTREPLLVLEYRYTYEGTDAEGRPVTREAFAWEARVRPLGVNPYSGKAYNFVGALNLANLWERGIDGVTVYTGDAWW